MPFWLRTSNALRITASSGLGSRVKIQNISIKKQYTCIQIKLGNNENGNILFYLLNLRNLKLEQLQTTE